MDPDETLRALRALLAEAGTDGDALADPASTLADLASIAEHFDALDRWIAKGGYLPVDWQRHQPTHEWMRSRPQS